VALRTLGGTLERQIAYSIPGTDLDHRIALIRKTGPSPRKYPRRWPQIKKKPL
jgi:16S rRNA (guanine527-N7)-methyltransferase